MIPKSLLFALFLFALWSAFSDSLPNAVPQHKWHKNVMNAERFLYKKDSPENVILGSSMGELIRTGRLENFYNLSLGGKSAMDGLHILKFKKDLPKRVFIEMNILDKTPNPEFAELLNAPFPNFLKTHFPAMRTNRQPVGVFLAGDFFDLKPDKKERSPRVKKERLERMIKFHTRSYSVEVGENFANEKLKKVKMEIDYLESKGVQVIFFEIPINPDLLKLNVPNARREKIKQTFPNNIFIDLPPNADEYVTKDGLHLTGKEAIAYTDYFKEQAK